MSYTCNAIWPMRIDLSSLECRQILREKELLCYADVVSVLRAQGPVTEEKKSVLLNLQKILSISDERNKAELRRAANNEKLATIAETVSGFDGYTEWTALGALKFLPTQRPTPRTVYCDQASQTAVSIILKEKDFPSPMDTRDIDLTDGIESAIFNNRVINKDRHNTNTDPNMKINCSTMTISGDNKNKSILQNQDMLKCNQVVSKDSSSSHNYNLHLLSEIATGESNQSDLMIPIKDEVIDHNLRSDSFFHKSVTGEIDQTGSATSSESTNQSLYPQQQQNFIKDPHSSRQQLGGNIMVPISSNMVLTACTVKAAPQPVPTSLNIVHQDLGGPVTNNSNIPMIISNSAGQRYVLPRNAISTSIGVAGGGGGGTNSGGTNISLLSTNNPHNKGPVTSFISQPPTSGGAGTYFTLSSSSSITNSNNSNNNNSNNGYIQLRLPTSHQHLSTNWTGSIATNQSGLQHQQQPQQVYIQNVSSTHHHGLGANVIHNQSSGEFSNSFSYALKQRSIGKDEQQKSHAPQIHQINNKLVVRNLGTPASSDSERNKRFMVVKGNSGAGSVGPTMKKPKMSNPSNRQPGRPPLMPAPSSAYTSRPYVANEIFHNSRSINTISSIACDNSSTTDSNGLKISSVSSGSRGIGAVNSSQVRSNLYSVNRGNGLQLTNSSSTGNKDSIVQLISGSQILTLDPSRNIVGAGGSSSVRTKNIHPLYSVVPLSPRGGVNLSDTVNSSNLPGLCNTIKDDGNDHNALDKDSLAVPYKIITKDEVYSNLMDRNNAPSIVSLSQTENKVLQ